MSPTSYQAAPPRIKFRSRGTLPDRTGCVKRRSASSRRRRPRRGCCHDARPAGAVTLGHHPTRAVMSSPGQSRRRTAEPNYLTAARRTRPQEPSARLESKFSQLTLRLDRHLMHAGCSNRRFGSSSLFWLTVAVCAIGTGCSAGSSSGIERGRWPATGGGAASGSRQAAAQSGRAGRVRARSSAPWSAARLGARPAGSTGSRRLGPERSGQVRPVQAPAVRREPAVATGTGSGGATGAGGARAAERRAARAERRCPAPLGATRNRWRDGTGGATGLRRRDGNRRRNGNGRRRRPADAARRARFLRRLRRGQRSFLRAIRVAMEPSQDDPTESGATFGSGATDLDAAMVLFRRRAVAEDSSVERRPPPARWACRSGDLRVCLYLKSELGHWTANDNSFFGAGNWSWSTPWGMTSSRPSNNGLHPVEQEAEGWIRRE